MYSKLITLVALAGASLVSALPYADADFPEGTQITVYPNGLPEHLKPVANETGIEKRASNAGVYLCNDTHFNGYCVHIVQPLYQCINLSGDLNDKVSAVGPDSPFYCFFFRAFNCNDSEGHFGTFSPGYDDLTQVFQGSFNDAISSYYCHPN